MGRVQCVANGFFSEMLERGWGVSDRGKWIDEEKWIEEEVEWGRYIDSNAMMRQLHSSAVQLWLCHNGGLGWGVIATLLGKRGKAAI